MRISYRALCLLALLILAVPIAAAPATALAQSAGDDQYVDPFKNDDGGNNGSGSQGSDQGSSNDNSTQSGDQSDTSGTAGTTAAQGTEDANGKLPRTGGGVSEAWIVVAGVVLLLGGGFALRRVWPRPD
jgi:LPXTG-motif cell wall-anchored protein